MTQYFNHNRCLNKERNLTVMSVLNVNYARKRFTPAISGKMSISVGGVMISKARLRYVYYRALFNVTIVAKDSVTQSNYV